MFEKFVFNLYKSITPDVFKKIIPVIDKVREFKNKSAIPIKEKMAEIEYPELGDKVIMLHGVSVGEVQSLENLIKKIKAEFKDFKLVITTGTVTGQELAKKKYCDIADFITYFPLDIYKSVETFLDKIKPKVILIAETELWPNFFSCAKEKNIPLYIINGRISDKSYPSYLRIKNFISLILGSCAGVFCQSEEDKKRFLSLGSPVDKTEVMKNLKFEIQKKLCDINLKTENYKVLIASSTHSGEEELMVQQYKKLKEKISNLKLIIAPRHLTRLNEVREALVGLNYGYRTQDDDFEKFDIIILDTLGELAKIYEIVDVAYIGGSFNKDKTGGHNPLEAIIYSKPVISGPSIKNFKDIYSILEREAAAFVVKNEKELYNSLYKLLSDDEFYKEISLNCNNCFKNQQGALDFVINKLKEIL